MSMTPDELKTYWKDDARNTLIALIKKGGHRIYTRLNYTTPSGQTHSFSLYLATDIGYIADVTVFVCKFLDAKLDKQNGIRSNGDAFGAAHDLIALLSSGLYPDEPNKLEHLWL